jgi:ABC-type lipoprotein release transport system permease subunit
MGNARKFLMLLSVVFIAVGLMAALTGTWEGLIVAGVAAIALVTVDKTKPGRRLPHKRYR